VNKQGADRLSDFQSHQNPITKFGDLSGWMAQVTERNQGIEFEQRRSQESESASEK
jgi:hypothetical protein